MIPIDAAIWKESDVRRRGISIESVLDTIKQKGARARIAVIDASRRNPYERRFRAFSHGLAPISAPDNALILSSATPGKVADDSSGPNSVLVTELLNNINSKAAGAEALFSKTRIAISRASNGEQVPAVSSSLREDVRLAAEMGAEKTGGEYPLLLLPGRASSARTRNPATRQESLDSGSAPEEGASRNDGCHFGSALAVIGRTGSPSRSSAPARATTMSPSTSPSRISTCPTDIKPTST